MKLLIKYCIFLIIPTLSAQPGKNDLKPDKELLKIAAQGLTQSVQQYKILMQGLSAEQWPRTYENGRLLTVSPYAWISGFYPGTLLYLYEFSRDSVLMNEVSKRLASMEKLQTVTANHDLGFMMYCSFGNAYRLKPGQHHKDILVRAAQSLATRFDPKVDCIKSWDSVRSLDGKTMMKFPVIIDNMMNLELLFFAHRAANDRRYYNIAVKHIESTIRNHLRPDYSSYHVVNYDPETGEVRNRETQQGFSDNSMWARGQAWGIYGFTMSYRETGEKRYLDVARKMADVYLDHPNLPEDKIPYWDFNVNQPGFTPQWKYDPARHKEIPRDASAAAVVASALIELAGYMDAKAGRKYLKAAEAMIRSLASKQYSATVGSNGGFILMHSSGGVPGNVEVDVPLSYADYYYVEALVRYRNLVRIKN